MKYLDKDKDKTYYLYESIQSKLYDIVKYLLLNYKFEDEIINEYFIDAVEVGDLKLVKLFIGKFGWRINDNSIEQSINVASHNKDKTLFKYLVKIKIERNAPSMESKTKFKKFVNFVYKIIFVQDILRSPRSKIHKILEYNSKFKDDALPLSDETMNWIVQFATSIIFPNYNNMFI